MNTSLLSYISIKLQIIVENISAVSGGDISQAFKLNTSKGNLFVKVNQTQIALEMFEAEKIGLQKMASTETIATPKVIDVGQFENFSFLILEHIDSKFPSSSEMELFGKQLAKMHNSKAEKFGLESNNFIGSLKQSNTFHLDWTQFYSSERLIPQLNISREKGLLKEYEIPSNQTISTSLASTFNDIKPALLHGDLWSGNFLISDLGTPYLIDPAVYYGDAEVDIAMSKLFGGFGDSFYESYLKESGLASFSDEKLELYQLYYLLVHLNLFGRSYYQSVSSIIKKYF